MNRKHVVLLGSAGTGTAFGAACALRRAWSGRVQIVAMDINPAHLVTTSLLSDLFRVVPPSSSSKFCEALQTLLHECNVDTYLPLLPEEIVSSARLLKQNRLPEGLTLIAPSVESSQACADKFQMFRVMQMQGLPVPRTYLGSDEACSGEVVVKPRSGSGSRGVKKLGVASAIMSMGIQRDSWILQEVLDSPEVTVDAFYDPKKSYCAIVCRERLEIKSGVSTKVRLFQSDAMRDLARSVAKTFSFTGSFCFQVMRGSEGWVIIDVNPRPGAATTTSLAAGNDFFSATFALSWGEDYESFFRTLREEHFVTRQYSDFLMGKPE